MSLHNGLTGSDLHVVNAFTYADEAARNAASGFTSADLGKVAWQQSDDSFYALTGVSPAAWTLLSSGGVLSQLNKVEVEIRKASSGTLAKGQAVYVSAWDDTNDLPLCELAKGDSASTLPVVGIVSVPATDSSTGKVLVVGLVRDLDTSGLTEGEPFYISATTAGEITSTPPSGPYVVQPLGTVLHADAGDGVLGVSVLSYRAIEYSSTPAALGTAAAGTANKASASDHVHAHGSQGGGSLHSEATTSVAGFLSAADKVKIDALPAVFGTETQNAASESESTTSSTSFVQKATISTPSIPAGTYRVGWNFEWQYESAANDALVRVQVDDSTTLLEMQQEPSDAGSDQWNPKGGFGYVTFGSAGTHTVDLDYRAANALYSAHIRRARLEIWRVS